MPRSTTNRSRLAELKSRIRALEVPEVPVAPMPAATDDEWAALLRHLTGTARSHMQAATEHRRLAERALIAWAAQTDETWAEMAARSGLSEANLRHLREQAENHHPDLGELIHASRIARPAGRPSTRS